jgi:hypothetical protein
LPYLVPAISCRTYTVDFLLLSDIDKLYKLIYI